jgi:Rhodopirellula transposase DDE domain
VQLIGSTTTDTGLEVRCEIDGNLYSKGIKVTDEEMEAINIARNEFHDEWTLEVAG